MTPNPQRQRLEGLFARGRISRGQFLAGLAACGLSAAAIEMLAGCEAALPDESEAVAAYLCLIVLDGFRPDYLKLAEMPAFQELVQRGTFYERAWVGQIESETPTGHATISTGSLPRHDGVIGFEWRDPVTRREVLDGWEQGATLGRLGREIERTHVNSIPQAIKRSDPSAVVVTASSEKVYAADAMSAHAADYVLYHRLSEGAIIPSALPGRLPSPDVLTKPALTRQLPLQSFTDWDDVSTELALEAFSAYRPKALMLNLPGTDYYGHMFGGPASPGVMSTVVSGQDRNIGRVVDAYRKAGILDQTLFVVTADHGMVPNHHEVGPDSIEAAVDGAGASYLFHTGGTAKYIYLLDRDRKRASYVAREVARLPGVVSAYYRAGANHYERAAPIHDSALDDAFRHLLGTFSGPSAPDVVAPYRESTIGTSYPQRYGNHGGLSWGAQAIPLLFAGPGVSQSVRSKMSARCVDIAPTVLRLLGLPSTGMDGVVLSDAISGPTRDEVTGQAGLEVSLHKHQEALIGQSEMEQQEDRMRGIRRLPMSPLRP